MNLIFFAVVLALIAGSIYAVWKSHEEAKAELRARNEESEFAKKQRFDSFMKAQSESRINITRQNRRVS